MKIKIAGLEVCSLCGSPWADYRGLDGNERVQCVSCGAGPADEDDPYTQNEGETIPA